LNVTSGDIILRNVMPSGIDFTQTNNCPRVLGPGISCSANVVFKPVVSGTRMGILIVSSSADNPVFVALSGTGE
jgi:hypothetical protein